MAAKHVVVAGDCCSSLAAKAGFADYHTIYDDGANAALKQKRPNPNTLVIGDELTIPGKELKTVPKPTGTEHKFVANVKRVKLRLQVRDSQDKPCEGKPFVLTVTGRDPKKGASLPDGFIEFEVDPQATVGSLILELGKPPFATPPKPAGTIPDPPPYPPALVPADFADSLDRTYIGKDADANKIEWTLMIGHLPSYNEVSGVQARLQNLGYRCQGKDGDAEDTETKAAVKAFQKHRKLPETGRAKDIENALRDIHDRKG